MCKRSLEVVRGRERSLETIGGCWRSTLISLFVDMLMCFSDDLCLVPTVCLDVGIVGALV